MENLTKEEKTYERHDVENTPFSIVKELPSGICKITVGKFIMCDRDFINIETAEGYIKQKPWDLIFNCMSLIAENINNIKNNQNSQSND